jgi:hypothetical protein
MSKRNHGSGRLAAHALLTVLTLSLALAGCGDIIELSEGAAEPDIAAGEGGAVFAQFDPDNRRLALPNDVVLADLVAEGLLVDGTARNMPIRIPFSGRIRYPFADDPPTFDAATVAAWGASVFVTDGATTFPAIPSYVGGDFKAVYLDRHNDLVLVPGDTQFTNGTTYAVVVTKDVKDASGSAIAESVAMYLVKQTSPIWKDGYCYSSLVDDAKCKALETLRAGLEASGLFPLLAAGGIATKDIALLFTFKVESTDSTSPTTGSGALIAGVHDATIGGTPVSGADIVWHTGAVPDTDFANALDFKAVFGAQASVTAIDKIYGGYYSCMNFLDSDGAGDWELDLPDPGFTVGTDCPNATGFTGSLEFWLSVPPAASFPPAGVVIFQHGITRDSTDFIAVANTLAGANYATIAIDIWAHGTRAYQILGQDVQYVRPDDPAKTVAYQLQTRADILHLLKLVNTNTELRLAWGDTAPASVHFVGQSLGGILGSLAGASALATFDTMILNVAGGDLVDVILEGEIGGEVIPAVAAKFKQEIGSPELNATLLGLEMGVRHALFAGLADPLAVYDPTAAAITVPDPVLLQQISGDSVVPNDNSELLSRVMELATWRDGDGNQTDTRSRWIYDRRNYGDGTAGHGFLLDNEVPAATTAGQTQMATFIVTGTVDDPSQ